MTTKGSEMIDALNTELDDLSEPSVNKKIKTSKNPNTTSFEPSCDSFELTTSNTKIFAHLFTFMAVKSDIGRLHFSPRGLYVSAAYHHETTFIATQLACEMLSKLNCNQETSINLNLDTFAKKFAMLNSFHVESITFKNDSEGNLQLLGTATDHSQKAAVTFGGLNDEVMDTEALNELTYDMAIKLSSKEFSRRVEHMPAVFSIAMDVHNACLVFSGKDSNSSTELRLYLSQSVMDTVKKFPRVCDYNQLFGKYNMVDLTKAATLSDDVAMSFGDHDSPLHLVYNLDTKSTVSVYVMPKCSDDEL